MFTLIEAFEAHPRRRWTALVGFTLEFAGLSALLVIPLLYPRSLPEAFARRRIFLPIASEPARTHVLSENPHIGSGLRIDPLVVVPRRITFEPQTNPSTTGENIVPPTYGELMGSNSGLGNLIIAEVVRPVPASPPPPNPIRHSVIMEGNLLYRVAPQYPTMAQRLGIQGSVLIKALISRAGTIEQTEVVSGQPLLSAAALSAVRQWKYRPYYLNGEPVEVETEITVNFVLNR